MHYQPWTLVVLPEVDTKDQGVVFTYGHLYD